MRFRLDKYEAFLIASSFVWGTSFVASKIGVEQMDPYFFAMLRFLIASPVLLLVAYLLTEFDLSIFKDPMIWGIGILNAVGLVLQNVGMTQTTATNAVLLVDINVVYVAILAAVILKERLTRFMVLGLVIGLLGIAIVATGGDMSQIMSGSFVGNIIVLAAGFVWAFYIVYQKKALNKHPDTLMMTSTVIVVTALASIPMALAFSKSFAVTNEGLLASFYVALICTGLAFLLYIAGLKGKGALASSIILLLEIVFAMLFAYLILGEIPTVATAIGGAFIVLAIVFVSVQENGKKKKEGPVEGSLQQ
jgi:drug/metabolite transporter (DMT)-like permease